jgi:hypothetical protein
VRKREREREREREQGKKKTEWIVRSAPLIRRVYTASRQASKQRPFFTGSFLGTQCRLGDKAKGINNDDSVREVAVGSSGD